MKWNTLSRLAVVAFGVALTTSSHAQDRQTPYSGQGAGTPPGSNVRGRNSMDNGGVRTTTRFLNGYFPSSDGGRNRMGGGNQGPLSPFILQGPAGNTLYGWNGFDNEVFSYTSPVSPFAQYRGNPNVGRFRYRNGMWGRGAISFGWGGWIFPGGNAYYPYYSQNWVDGYTCPALYGYLWGANSPYLFSQYLYQSPPTVIYVPYPVYSEQGSLKGWKKEDVDDYYLNRKVKEGDASKEEKGQEKSEPTKEIGADTPIGKVAQEIRSLWKQGDIQALSNFVDKGQRIAVYLRGKYQYSMSPADYLDMTRDAIQSTKTLSFALDTPKEKEKGVWLLTGKHTYIDKENEQRTVYVSYVLEEKGEKFVLTQVGVSPQKIEKVSKRETFVVQEVGDKEKPDSTTTQE